MAELKIISEAGFLLPLKDISAGTIEKAQKRFHHRFYQEAKCAKCPFLEERHGENCENCSAFVGARITAKKVVYKNKEYLSIPRGHRSIALKLAERDPNVTSVRVVTGHKVNQPMKRAISLLDNVVLKDYQVEAVQAAFEKRRGIIKSPPRSGKTLIATAFMCQHGGKTIVLAHQREWLLQFKETFYGSKTQQGFTDAKPGQVDLARKLEDFERLDVCLCTFSQFMSDKGKSTLEKIRGMFSSLVVDECHKTPALATSRVLAAFNVKYAIGLSGTPARKITAEIAIAHDLIGPIIYESKVVRERPKVVLLDTPGQFEFNTKMGRAALPSLQSKLENHKERRLKIIKFAIKQAQAGHLVMIPLTRVRSILEWTRLINEMTEKRAYAVPFYGGVPKDFRMKVMERLRLFKSRIVIGNIAMLSTGLNIPRASMLIEQGITSNLPNAEQRFARILTPMDDKPQPTIVFTMDDCDFMRKCRMNEFWNVLVRQFNPIIDPTVKSRLVQYFQSSSGGSGGRADFFKDV
jgi:superfamily II DNA or RNA helicase